MSQEDDAFAVWLRVSVRAHFKALLGFQNWSDLAIVSPSLTDDERDAFLLEDMPPPTASNFRIDFVRSWDFTWNKYARYAFCTDFARAVQSGRYKPDQPGWVLRVDREMIGIALDKYVEYARVRYHRG
ncbi:hypothetical protein K466DRAFT_597591 [Polyporus arcularius HHB13444]|uniref:Uncharacterized protein n=1 Tax=Polyporus arcularius HHB13444 TaxID=1314778 RepID=A0A5C3PJZ5_9APHY|nr:hypothetical protein K466DRAFT_597591 [Polyporus arcularius HHB13444]